MASEEDDDDVFSNFEKDLGDDLIIEWAKVSLLYFAHYLHGKFLDYHLILT